MKPEDATPPWASHQPIYRQLREKIVGLLLTGALPEGEALPSVRQLASDYNINHITVSKAYQELVDMQLVEVRRGMGMYVAKGARKKLYEIEKQKFLSQELPALLKRMDELAIDLDDLFDAIRKLTGRP